MIPTGMQASSCLFGSFTGLGLPRAPHRDYYVPVDCRRPERSTMRIARWAFLLLLIAPLGAASARAQDQQDDSLAAAARRAQDAKKDQSKAPKVYDNDNLPTTGAVNVIGQDQSSAGPASSTGAANPSSAAAKPVPSARELSAMDANVSAAKELLKNLKAISISRSASTCWISDLLRHPLLCSGQSRCRRARCRKSDIDARPPK